MSDPTTTPRTRHPVRLAAMVVGVVFLLVGILGFVPGVTANYDRMAFAGHDSGALLLGVFAVSVLHNLVHLAFGVAGVAMARTASGARSYLIGHHPAGRPRVGRLVRRDLQQRGDPGGDRGPVPG